MYLSTNIPAEKNLDKTPDDYYSGAAVYANEEHNIVMIFDAWGLIAHNFAGLCVILISIQVIKTVSTWCYWSDNASLLIVFHP